jgi:transposase
MDAIGAESERMTAANPRGPVRALNRRRLRVTPPQLRRVAEIVRTCDGRPVDAVADALDVGIRAAQLWIKRTRDNIDPETGHPYLEGDSE